MTDYKKTFQALCEKKWPGIVKVCNVLNFLDILHSCVIGSFVEFAFPKFIMTSNGVLELVDDFLASTLGYDKTVVFSFGSIWIPRKVGSCLADLSEKTVILISSFNDLFVDHIHKSSANIPHHLVLKIIFSNQTLY
ncbi:hypothetical protein BpHYR1_032182 [Brachionus plicatilis]|uniref:Uncharacterized protein n=1 Tax=Brachionus plicatilis TaxID=10195 RepID=A0A3M7QQI9_BRAPC|nr:hypothetical protein BpHYR1_032182 [Brachionus plicatilis]